MPKKFSDVIRQARVDESGKRTWWVSRDNNPSHEGRFPPLNLFVLAYQSGQSKATSAHLCAALVCLSWSRQWGGYITGCFSRRLLARGNFLGHYVAVCRHVVGLYKFLVVDQTTWDVN